MVWKTNLSWAPDAFILGATASLAVLTVVGALAIRPMQESISTHDERVAESGLQTATPTEVRTIIEKQFTTGVVTRVVDGDTVEMEIDGKLVNVRLFGIDAPEMSQPFGQKSKDFLARRILNEELIVIPRDVDSYDRLVAGLYRSSDKGISSISIGITYEGFGWAYREYLKEELEFYLLSETDARKHKRGLWVADAAVPPWVWRKKQPASQ